MSKDEENETSVLVEATKQKNAMLALRNTEGWHILEATIKKVIEAETNRVMYTELSPQWTSYQQEFAKGNAHGLRTVLKLVENFVNIASELEESLKDGRQTDDRDADTISGDAYEFGAD